MSKKQLVLMFDDTGDTVWVSFKLKKHANAESFAQTINWIDSISLTKLTGDYNLIPRVTENMAGLMKDDEERTIVL